MRSNLHHWKSLQEKGYFESHPCYLGLSEQHGAADIEVIDWFIRLKPTDRVVVIGCGYGRETSALAGKVGGVFGIDVNETILSKARSYLAARSVHNCTLVLAESFERDIPSGINLVFSIVVMQHLTRDLVDNYFRVLAQKMAPGGSFVVQFLEVLNPNPGHADAEDREYEPSVSWTVREVHALAMQASLIFAEVRTIEATPDTLWHWVHLKKPD